METILIGAEARSKLLKGVNKLASSIKGTLGPQARTVIIQNPMGMPVILNDGVTIARAVTDPDPYVQMGIDLLKEVASEAQEKSGDGTTTATLIAQTLCNGSLTLMENGVSPLRIRDELKNSLQEVTEYIEENAITDFDLIDVATIASNNDQELGELIADVVNGGGGITIEKSPTQDTYVRASDGLEINSGIVHTLMANTGRGKCEFNNPLILTTTERIESFNTLVPALEASIQEGRPLAVFCPDINPQMLQNLLVNIVQGKVSVCIVKVPGMPQQQQEWLEDISASTGSKVFKTSLNESIINATSQELGECEKLHSNSTTTTLTLKENALDAEYLQELLDAYKEEENDWVKEQLLNRYDRLDTGITTIYVGGASDVEQVETKERVDDAVNACKLALNSGVVIGGGATLWRYAQSMEIEDTKTLPIRLLFKKAMQTPLNTIVENTGATTFPSDDSRLVNEGLYICGKTGEIENALDDGVVDPMQVVLNSVESAVSIAALVLMTDCAIVAPKQ